MVVRQRFYPDKTQSSCAEILPVEILKVLQQWNQHRPFSGYQCQTNQRGNLIRPGANALVIMAEIHDQLCPDRQFVLPGPYHSLFRTIDGVQMDRLQLILT